MKRYSEVLRELRKRMQEPSKPPADVKARLKEIREEALRRQQRKELA